MTSRIRNTIVAVTLFAAQSLPALPASAQATQTVTLNPTADTYVWTGDSGAVNYGTQPNISILYGSSAARARSLLRFDLSSIPSDATVSKATLGLTLSSTSGSGTITMNVFRATQDWMEEIVTWNTQPTTNEQITSSLVNRDPGTKTWDLTTAAQNWISGAWANQGFIVIGRESGAATDAYTRLFWSREGATPPTLSITYTVPADTRAPSITNVAISNVTDTSVVITWTTDEAGTSIVDYGTSTAYGSIISDATFTTAHTVVLTGLTAETTYHFRVTSADANNNSSSSNDQAITTNKTPLPTSGRLIKTACPADAAVDHPCRAIYYHGTDGARHAFPNERIYSTWYADFSTVVTVTDAEMAALPLGANVHYRPGVRMVKFQTLPKVYAVSRGGALRWIQNEGLATALYGSDWNKKIDDLSDAFAANYAFGADIIAASDYSPSGETASTPTIDADQGR